MKNCLVLSVCLMFLSLTSYASGDGIGHTCEKKVCSLSEKLFKLKQRSAASIDAVKSSDTETLNGKQKK